MKDGEREGRKDGGRGGSDVLVQELGEEEGRQII